MSIGDAAAWTSAVIAVIAAGISIWQAAGARKARVETVKYAKDSAEAAKRSADAEERSVALQEAAARAAEPPKVAWRVEHVRNQAYRLQNIGTDLASGVTGEVRPDNGLAINLPAGVDLRPWQSHEFVLMNTAELTTPSEVWVTWNGASGAVAVPIPAR